MSAVGAAECGAHAETALRKIQPIANRPADAVIGNPEQMGKIDAALQHHVLNQAAHGIVGQRGDDGSAQIEAAAQAAGYVIFAAAFPGAKIPGRGHALVARIEAQHHFAQADKVPAAGLTRLQVELLGFVHSCISFQGLPDFALCLKVQFR